MSVSKFTNAEKPLVKSLVASLSIKRIPDNEIINEICRQTDKKVSRIILGNIRRSIKKDSFEWYQCLRANQYSYIYEFKNRVVEIEVLQRMHYKIIKDNERNPSIVQTSLAELLRLSITLSNLYDVAPTLVNSVKKNDTTIPVSQQDRQKIIV